MRRRKDSASGGRVRSPHRRVCIGACSDRGRQRGRGVGRVAPPSPAAVPGHAARAAAAPAPGAPATAALPAGEPAAGAGPRTPRPVVAATRSRSIDTARLARRLMTIIRVEIQFLSCQSIETCFDFVVRPVQKTHSTLT